MSTSDEPPATLRRIERPLVALEEDHGVHLARRRRSTSRRNSRASLAPSAAVLMKRGHDLHVGARDVPAELGGGQAVLRFRQALRPGAGQQGHADAAGVDLRDRRWSGTARRARRRRRPRSRPRRPPARPRASSASAPAARRAPPVVDGEQRDDDPRPRARGCRGAAPRGSARGTSRARCRGRWRWPAGAGRGRSCSRRTARRRRAGKGTPRLTRCRNARGGEAGLDQRQVAVHAAAGEVGLGHGARRVRVVAAHAPACSRSACRCRC